MHQIGQVANISKCQISVYWFSGWDFERKPFYFHKFITISNILKFQDKNSIKWISFSICTIQNLNYSWPDFMEQKQRLKWI